jgi:hypothetical protein
MGRKFEGAGLYHRGARLPHMDSASTNLLLKPRCDGPEMSTGSTELTTWISHLGARKLRIGHAIVELERTQRVLLESHSAPAKDKLAEGGSEGDQTMLNST